ncbi:MAG TPA: tripartite tricarboxylate transporter substrate binding protein [Falsiroseomonas sp.]|nr:tripartite tricarboxylate transporter substrate binding protein [Falsiroseomonas sp.]
MSENSRSATGALSRRALIGATAAAGLVSAPGIARAQSFPDRPVNVIVPFATGGYNDRLARAFAPFLQKELGQPVTITNRPGGGTVLGHSLFLRAEDGYTICCTSVAPFIPLSILVQNASYKAEDFHMVNLPSRDFTLLATSNDKPFQNIGEVVDQLKRDPRSISVGVQPNSADYVNLALLMDASGVDRSRMRIVTYDGGGPARNATAGGHVDVGLVGGEGFLPIKSRIRPLLVFAESKVPDYDVTTIVEFAGTRGFPPEFVEGSQRGWVLQAALLQRHPDRAQILSEAIERATKNPECVTTLQGQQLATDWYGPEASNRAFRTTFEALRKHASLLKA